MKIENYDMATVLMHKIKDAHLHIRYIENNLLDKTCFNIYAKHDGVGLYRDVELQLEDEFKKEILMKCIEKNKKWIEEWTSILDSL